MSWKSIKKAINSTIGTPNFKPLDKLIKDGLEDGTIIPKYSKEAPMVAYDPNDLESGNTFSFANTNGFGLRKGSGAKGFWRLWSLQDSDGSHYVALVPSYNGKQRIGSANSHVKVIFVDNVGVAEYPVENGYFKKITSQQILDSNGKDLMTYLGGYQTLIEGLNSKEKDVKLFENGSFYSNTIELDYGLTEARAVIEMSNGEIYSNNAGLFRLTSGTIPQNVTIYEDYRPIILIFERQGKNFQIRSSTPMGIGNDVKSIYLYIRHVY